LPWQPILGAKWAEIGDTPFFLELAFQNGWQDGKADGALTAQKSCLDRVKIDELWSTKSGVYDDDLAIFYVQNARNHRNAFDSWDWHSTMDGRNR